MTGTGFDPAGNEDQDSGRRYRPPAGLPPDPVPRSPWSIALSIVLHVVAAVLVVWFALRPAARTLAKGALGASRAGAVLDRLRFFEVGPAVKLAPTPAPAARRAPAQTPPPVPVHAPAPAAVPPPAVRTPAPTDSEQQSSTGTSTGDSAATGTSGDQARGPPDGGGAGGTGSGASGAGGGSGTIYPATPDFAVLPPLPVPKHLEGTSVELRFTLDARGAVLKFDFDPTGDERYDQALRQRLSEYRFRPAHRADGTPVASVFITRLIL